MTQASDTEPSPMPAASGGRGGDKRPGYGNRVSTYNRQVVSEMRKVLWPTREELITYTIVSVTFVVAMVAFVGLLDYGFTKLIFHVFG